MSTDLQQLVASSGDAANLHATVPTLMLELQTLIGALAATVTAGTERGRRPFRPGADWAGRLGELAYGIYLLADQTGVVVSDAVAVTAAQVARQAQTVQSAQNQSGWPFEGA